MENLKFEDIPTEYATILRRAKVPGGWLVTAVEEVIHNLDDRGLVSGWDWRTSVCYVPDPEGTWLQTIGGE